MNYLPIKYYYFKDCIYDTQIIVDQIYKHINIQGTICSPQLRDLTSPEFLYLEDIMIAIEYHFGVIIKLRPHQKCLGRGVGVTSAGLE